MGRLDAIKDLLDDFHENSKEGGFSFIIALVTLIIGIILSLLGIGLNKKAKKINNEADSIKKATLERYKKSEQEAQESLDSLGDLQIEIAETFSQFSDAAERLECLPTGLAKKISKVKLPELKYTELKKISNDIRVAVDGVGGFAAGLGVGYAAFGLNPIVLAPGALAGGVVLCAKGASLLQKSVKNVKEAKRLDEEVKKIEQFHYDLKRVSSSLYNSMLNGKDVYYNHLSAFIDLVAVKQNWKFYTEEEKVLVQNTFKLTALMQKMCTTHLVKRDVKEEKMETINEEEVKEVITIAEKLLPSIA